ncbi:MAG: hypothetical protein RL320_1874 [Pseudomonadota bacterium]
MTFVARMISVGLLAALPVAASAVSFAKPEQAIKYRQSTFSVMATHFSDIGAMVKGDKPFDAKAAAVNADVVATLSALPWAGFGPGTEGGKAKAAIWKETGNLDNIKKAFGATAQTCKACHDSYKDK